MKFDEIERILQGQFRTGKHNSHMPTDVLEKLSQHPKDTIRYLVATYHTASATTLERLAFDEYELIRQKVGANPNTPHHILESFSQDENPAIRQATASNPNLPERILAQLLPECIRGDSFFG